MLLGILLSIPLLLSACNQSKPTIEEQYQAKIQALDKDSYLHQQFDNIIPLTIQEAKDKINNKETFILYHGRSDCRFCKYVYPELSKQLKNGETAYYVNLDYFILLKPEDETSELFTYNDNLYKEYLNFWGIQGSPNIMYVKDGEIFYETSMLLNPAFFDANSTENEKQEYLDYMAQTINGILSLYREQGNISNTKPSVTIKK